MQGIIDRGIPVQRYKTNPGQFVRAPSGRHIRLVGADNRPTPAGRVYYEKLGVPPPQLYDYDQPLIQDKWIKARDGSKILVRKRGDDGQWIIVPKGEDYFRYNRSEYLPRVPYLVANRPTQELVGGTILPVYNIVRPPRVNQYMGLVTDGSSAVALGDDGGALTLTVGQVRQTRAAAGRPLHGAQGSRVHHAEVRAATISIVQGYSTLRGTDGQRYHILGADSEVLFVWDTERPIMVDERRTNFWDDQPPTTETILGRPLRSSSLPDGMWRPFDMHPDTFQEFAHGCAVQMLLKSFTKPYQSGYRKRMCLAKDEEMTVEEIIAELDMCFEELGYTAGEYPFEHGWREDGVTADMVVKFSLRQACYRPGGRGTPLRCSVFHRGQKVLEFVPENCKSHTPTVLFSIFGDHAFFLRGR